MMKMSEDYRVNRRSDHQVRDRVLRTKIEYKVDGRFPVNIIRCVETGWVQTEFGKKTLSLKIVDDAELGAEGRTEYSPAGVTITVAKSVYQRAKMGDGRSRMTLAHELGHAVLHFGEAKYRRADASGTTVLSRINASESAEHQAKVFASAFLIDDKFAAEFGSAEEISVQFGVSLTAAEICLERLFYQAEHAVAAERVQQMSLEAKAALLGKPEMIAPTYADGLCISCRNATLIPIGSKVLCDTCGFIGDQLQDRDQ
jgi:hypothetical protein